MVEGIDISIAVVTVILLFELIVVYYKVDSGISVDAYVISSSLTNKNVQFWGHVLSVVLTVIFFLLGMNYSGWVFLISTVLSCVLLYLIKKK